MKNPCENSRPRLKSRFIVYGDLRAWSTEFVTPKISGYVCGNPPGGAGGMTEAGGRLKNPVKRGAVRAFAAGLLGEGGGVSRVENPNSLESKSRINPCPKRS